MPEAITVQQMASARIPTDAGEFSLSLYHNTLDDKEHLALVAGDISGEPNVLVRVHSECFTGDVLGSLRCDCGPQLAAALRLIAVEGRGIILYMRQEGRGIGLLEKLRAYNLQDEGYDTVDANLMLGHQPDLRDYRVAALILKDLGVSSLRLLTNNPDKIAGLEEAGLTVSERVPLQTTVNSENAHYLDTKVRRMRHLLALDRELITRLQAGEAAAGPRALGNGAAEGLPTLIEPGTGRNGRPFVTLSYAQSLDGSIAARRGEQTLISGPEAMRLTHQMRARHDAILVGIGTVLADDPQLTVRLVRGRDPQPIVLDSRLRFPTWARMLREGRRPWIFTTPQADAGRKAQLEAAGARVVALPADAEGMVDLPAMLDYLAGRHIRSLMVEGGAMVIGAFLAGHLADRLALTIAPLLVGGLNAVAGGAPGGALPGVARARTFSLGRDVILIGDLE